MKPNPTSIVTTSQRKDDHIRINLEENVAFDSLKTGFADLFFEHCALPELDLAAIDTRQTLFGKTLQVPLLISSMTGGTVAAQQINRVLAIAAAQSGIAMGLGSMRVILEDPTAARSFQLRDVAPDILLFANIGAIQLNYGCQPQDCLRLVELVEANGLILHLNPLQEAVQPEGDTNFSALLPKIATVCELLARHNIPVIAKEVGWGFSPRCCTQLANAGVQALDVAGAGGTSWSQVERHRAQTFQQASVAAAFADWGIPTTTAVRFARNAAPQVPIFASGGLQNGLDAAKSIALGATLAGFAGPLLKAAVISSTAVSQTIDTFITQLRVAMFCAGAADLASLRQTRLLSRHELYTLT